MVLEAYTKKGKHIQNQDAYKTYEDEDKVILSVADGHGFYMHFRSATGSKLAVQCAIEVFKYVTIDTLKDKENELVISWQKAVKKYNEENEISNVEWFLANEFAPYYKNGKLPILYAYGTTVLIAIYFKKENKLYISRVGDGEILKINKRNRIFDLVEKEDFGSEYITESLCEDNPNVKNNLEDSSFVSGLDKNDTLIVASDGLSKFSNMNEIILLLKKFPEELQSIVDNLDNVDDFTIIVFKP